MNYSYSASSNAPHSFPSTPIQQDFGQFRPSIDPSQLPASGYSHPHQGFYPQLENLELSSPYGSDPQSDWTRYNTDYEITPISATGSLNINEINGIASSRFEDPWNANARAYGQPRDNPQLSNILDSIPNQPGPHTVAAERYTHNIRPKRKLVEEGQQNVVVVEVDRPSIGTAQSSASHADSGYASLHLSGTDNRSHVYYTETKKVGYVPVISDYGNTAARGRALSVQTEPILRQSKPIGERKARSIATTCETCNKQLKNKSEVEKHKLQHEKPNQCKDCTEKSFATFNDLERHRKCVHGSTPRVGKTSVYICLACVLQSSSPSPNAKVWPRLDNFKAHIKRKHVQWDQEELIGRSECEPGDAKSDPTRSQPSMSISPRNTAYQVDWPTTVDNATRQPPHQPNFQPITGLDSAHQVAHTGGIGDYDVNTAQSGRGHFRIPQYGAYDSRSIQGAVALQQISSPGSATVPRFNVRHSAPSAPTLQLNGKPHSLHEGMDIDHSPKRARTLSNISTTSSANSHSASSSQTHSKSNDASSTTVTEQQLRCPLCNKPKKRDCDLRKHMKRHTRPYGCTFAQCTKKFGSRNDWKRHENSQHFLKEMWRCDLKRKSSTAVACGYLAHDKTTFAIHLQTKHDIEPGSLKSKTTCTDMHLGREGHHHFWCGFCNKLISQQDGIQPTAWDIRFKHIGDHFDKENLCIDDWIDIEKNRKKKLVDGEAASKRALTRGAMAKFDDDSDLGEDGIPDIPCGEEIDVDAEGVSDDEWN